MSSRWRDRLRARIDALDGDSRRRRLPGPAPDGTIDLRTNDYLDLRRHPHIREAVASCVHAEAWGSGASRLVAQTHPRVAQAERRFARFKSGDDDSASLLLSSGYAANVALLGALAGPHHLVLADKLCHASVIDGARLAHAARADTVLRTFPHLDAERALDLGVRAARRGDASGCIIVTDSVFSMDGTSADLASLARVRDELDPLFEEGVCLVADEAHATGILGPTGAGLDELAGHRADATVSTASKALGGIGGIVTGSPEVIECVVNFARSFIFSTGVPPAHGAALEAALDLVRDEPDRRARLVRISGDIRRSAEERGWGFPHRSLETPVLPLVAGSNEAAMALSAHLLERGILAPAIRPPTVAPGTARVRLSLHAGLGDDEVGRIIEAIPPA